MPKCKLSLVIIREGKYESSTLQIWVNVLVDTLQHLDQVTSGSRVALSEEGNGGTLLASTTGTTDTVNVVLNIVGKIKVDHELDVLNVYTINNLARVIPKCKTCTQDPKAFILLFLF